MNNANNLKINNTSKMGTNINYNSATKTINNNNHNNSKATTMNDNSMKMIKTAIVHHSSGKNNYISNASPLLRSGNKNKSPSLSLFLPLLFPVPWVATLRQHDGTDVWA